jgi:carboxymethylenebutenolidase
VSERHGAAPCYDSIMPPEVRRVAVGARSIEVEIYRPTRAGDGPWPGVVLLHELFGVTANVRADAADLAAHGYLTWAPNLYTGNVHLQYCIRTFFTREGLLNRDSPELREVGAVLDALKADPACNRRLGMIGMCMTGGFVLHMATRDDLDAPVVYHHGQGVLGAGVEPEVAARIDGPVQGHFARGDLICPERRARALGRLLGDRLETHWHDRAGHGLRSRFRHTPAGVNAWKATLDFLDRQLRTAPAAPAIVG